MILFLFLILLTPIAEAKPPSAMVKISRGTYQPFYNKNKEGVKENTIIESFFVDIYPVTNIQFLTFVKSHPQWSRKNVKRIFADDLYLKHWTADYKIPVASKLQPVVYVSWFAANAYCESFGKTLPTIIQWEYIAAADETRPYAMNDEKYKQRILQWYSKPNHSQPPLIGQSKKNYWGIHDLHGLIWEWTLDFNTALVTGESREDSGLNRNKFCGSGALNAKDKLDYGAFMRFGFRSSLKGNYTVGSLGFRCVKNIKTRRTK